MNVLMLIHIKGKTVAPVARRGVNIIEVLVSVGADVRCPCAVYMTDYGSVPTLPVLRYLQAPSSSAVPDCKHSLIGMHIHAFAILPTHPHTDTACTGHMNMNGCIASLALNFVTRIYYVSSILCYVFLHNMCASEFIALCALSAYVWPGVCLPDTVLSDG